jgi:hypothetical protein
LTYYPTETTVTYIKNSSTTHFYHLHMVIYIYHCLYFKYFHKIKVSLKAIVCNVRSVAILSLEVQIEEESDNYSLCILSGNSTVKNEITFGRYGLWFRVR